MFSDKETGLKKSDMIILSIFFIQRINSATVE